jgi:mannose-6-phosphate isomerase-like protein (cupin superfamily)
MGENSLIIISRNEKEAGKNEKRSLLVMVDGQLQGKLSQHDKERRNMEISTPAAVIRVPAGGKDLSSAEFKVSINEDRSSTFTILKGSAEVVAQGQSVLVNANQTTTVGLNEPPPVPRELTPEVTLIDPINDQVIYYRDIPPRVRFSWRALPDEREYHILVSKDRDFSTPVVDEWVMDHFFVHGNLKEGDYFCKVGLRKKGACETRQIHMVRITKAPAIQLEAIPLVVRADRYVIKGTTDPHVRVIIEGKEVGTDGAGRFEYTLRLQQGVNSVVVEAVDKAGNTSFRVVRVFAKN